MSHKTPSFSTRFQLRYFKKSNWSSSETDKKYDDLDDDFPYVCNNVILKIVRMCIRAANVHGFNESMMPFFLHFMHLEYVTRRLLILINRFSRPAIASGNKLQYTTRTLFGKLDKGTCRLWCENWKIYRILVDSMFTYKISVENEVFLSRNWVFYGSSARIERLINFLW